MTTVIEAAKTLLSICDGARTKDGSGYNGGDSMMVREILSNDTITDRQESKLNATLQKYSKQLTTRFGIDYNELETEYVEHHQVVPGSEKVMINFGKYKGKTLAEITEIDSGYITWLSENSFNNYIKNMATNIVNGKSIKMTEKKQNVDVVELTLSPSNTIRVRTSYKYKDVIKSVSDRKWNPDLKVWEVPLNVLSEILDKFPDAELSDKVKEIVDKQNSLTKLSDKVSNGETIKFSDDLILLPFQTVGVEFLDNNNGSALIADEMGLGKTVQALAWLRKHPENRPTLVVCPASLKLNWRNEAEKWLSSEDEIFVVNKTYESDRNIYIINYDILKKWNKQLVDSNFNTIIFDESHYLKNGKAQRTKFAEKLAKNIPNKILLTGTPILNRPNELWKQLSIINSDLFPNFFKYGIRYCGAYKNDFGWDFSGATNKEELNEKLKSIMVRRTKSQVLTELPDKRRSSISFDIDEKYPFETNEYRIAEYDFPKYYRENIKNEVLSNGEELVRIEILKQLATKYKMDNVITWIKEFLKTDEKIVLFAHHKDVINTISEKFPDISVKLTGSTKMEDRQKAVDEFQNNPDIKIFIGNIKSASVGITLTSSSCVAFIELPWTPGDLVQAEDRVHRIGQKNAVNVYYLVANDTVEEDIAYILQKKAKVIDQIIDGKISEFNLFDELRKLKEIRKDLNTIGTYINKEMKK